ncbi:MAG: VanW family protein, partial [Clostridia bacterium]|nr:VanW family protein [Clostridia bacterium]
KMKKLNYNNETIINYLFPNFFNKIKLIQKNIEKPYKNAEIKYNSNNKISIKKEINGIKINYDLFFEELFNKYSKDNLVEIKIPCETINPEITEKDLKQYTNLRSTFSTNFSSSIPDRKHNIRQAVQKINKIVVEKDEVFSFNKVVGRRTTENGFRVAKIISNGEFVDGVGGGVCQVSSTLYNAVLKAGLKIVQANKHSERVGYVQKGFDAMVNYGSSDLQFKNNTENKIIILANSYNDKINISIFGVSLNGYCFKLRNEVFDIIPAGEEKVEKDEKGEHANKVKYEDEWFYLKTAKDGYSVKSFRDIYFNGELLKTELLRTDKFKPQNAVKMYGSIPRINLDYGNLHFMA